MGKAYGHEIEEEFVEDGGGDAAYEWLASRPPELLTDGQHVALAIHRLGDIVVSVFAEDEVD